MAGQQGITRVPVMDPELWRVGHAHSLNAQGYQKGGILLLSSTGIGSIHFCSPHLQTTPRFLSHSDQAQRAW